jgi:DNA mismatch repair protein MutH
VSDVVAWNIDYRVATEAQILERSRTLPGCLLGQLGSSIPHVEGVRGKGQAGRAIEAFFGIPANSKSEADFPGAGIELKALPIRRAGKIFNTKERTVISMIDYLSIVEERWENASVRKKLKILFVFFEHLHEAPKDRFPVLDFHLWTPDDRTNDLLRADWERVRQKVRHGLAHELSEGDGRIMGPCTKGVNARSRRRQPFSDIPAKPRAFALKPAFTLEIFRQVRSRPPRVTIGGLPDDFENRMVTRFRPFVGRGIDDVADELAVARSNSKSYAAAVARRIFGGTSFKGEIREFAEMGLTPRIARVNDDLMPYEATSFPSFRYRELIQEEWMDSDLLSRVEYMLFIPVHGRTKATPQGDCTFGAPRFWRPSDPDLELMRREWELFRIEIERGRALKLTPASETTAIHVRPHGRNARDTDDAPGVGQVVKKSFWLNQPFVAEILRGIR